MKFYSKLKSFRSRTCTWNVVCEMSAILSQPQCVKVCSHCVLVKIRFSFHFSFCLSHHLLWYPLQFLSITPFTLISTSVSVHHTNYTDIHFSLSHHLHWFPLQFLCPSHQLHWYPLQFLSVTPFILNQNCWQFFFLMSTTSSDIKVWFCNATMQNMNGIRCLFHFQQLGSDENQ